MLADLDRFYRDLLADAMSAASAQQWRERAEVLRAARPRSGDFHGASTVEDRRARWRRLTEIAKACEARADLLERHGVDVPEVDDFPIWEEAA